MSKDVALQQLLSRHILPFASRRDPDLVEPHLRAPVVEEIFCTYKRSLKQLFCFYASITSSRELGLVARGKYQQVPTGGRATEGATTLRSSVNFKLVYVRCSTQSWKTAWSYRGKFCFSSSTKVAQFSLLRLICVCVVLVSVDSSSVYAFCSRFQVDWIRVNTRLFFDSMDVSYHCIVLQTKSIVKVTSGRCFLVMYEGRWAVSVLAFLRDGWLRAGVVVGTHNNQQLTTHHISIPSLSRYSIGMIY